MITILSIRKNTKNFPIHKIPTRNNVWMEGEAKKWGKMGGITEKMVIFAH
ncbi:MAG: hypothetical protein K2N16_08080 [Muribaculaceae bacterium]|nr:hypothetical protein [Muribaculaceae bacterium]